MRLDWAMLANAAEIREGVAYVMSGGIDTVNATQLPATFSGAVLIRFLLHRTELERQHSVEVRFLDEDGDSLVQMHGNVSARPSEGFPIGWDYPVMLTVNIARLSLKKLGRYSVEILGDGSHLASLNLRVVLTKARPATDAGARP